jgi:hypothetical protein
VNDRRLAKVPSSGFVGGHKRVAQCSTGKSLYSVHSRRRTRAGSEAVVRTRVVRLEHRDEQERQEQIHTSIPVETGRLHLHPAEHWPTACSCGTGRIGGSVPGPGCQGGSRLRWASKFVGWPCASSAVPFELIPTEQTTARELCPGPGADAPPQPSDNGASKKFASLAPWSWESWSLHIPAVLGEPVKTLEPGQLCRLEHCRWRPGRRHHSSPNITGSGAPQPARLGKKLMPSKGEGCAV